MKNNKTQVVAIYIPVKFINLPLDKIRIHLFNGFVLRKNKITKYNGNSVRVDCRIDKTFWEMVKQHALKENITIRELTESIIFSEMSKRYER